MNNVTFATLRFIDAAACFTMPFITLRLRHDIFAAFSPAYFAMFCHYFSIDILSPLPRVIAACL